MSDYYGFSEKSGSSILEGVPAGNTESFTLITASSSTSRIFLKNGVLESKGSGAGAILKVTESITGNVILKIDNENPRNLSFKFSNPGYPITAGNSVVFSVQSAASNSAGRATITARESL